MRLKEYIKDNIINIIIYFATLIILFLFFRVLKLSKEALISAYTILAISGLLLFFYNYGRKKVFYDNFTKH